jgi:hypothetical protein
MIFQIPQTAEELIKQAEAKLNITGFLSELGPSERGWSLLSKFLRCDYLAFYESPEGSQDQPPQENENTALGTLVHRLLELHYLPEPVCDPIIFLGALKEVGLSADLYDETKRVFTGYVNHYAGERSWLTPLGAEQKLEDPDTKLTCKIDLLYDSNGHGRYPDGIHVLDHKTRSRIDGQCMNEWYMDGQALLYMYICRQNQIDVRGFVANIVGKQKQQRFERIYVAAEDNKLARFRDYLFRMLEEYERVKEAKARGVEPIRRFTCTGRYGLCDLFNHCKSAISDPYIPVRPTMPKQRLLCEECDVSFDCSKGCIREPREHAAFSEAVSHAHDVCADPVKLDTFLREHPPV